MDDDLDLRSLLDGGDVPEATPEVLRAIVSRHRGRVRRHRALSALALVLVMAVSAAAVGVELNRHPGAKTATPPQSGSSTAAPSGLVWDAAPAGLHGTTAKTSGRGFGFVAGHEASNAIYGPALGAVVPAGTNSPAQAGRSCAYADCDVVSASGTFHLVFIHRVAGLTITAYLEYFTYPSTVGATGRGVAVPTAGGSVASGTASASAAPGLPPHPSTKPLPLPRHTLPAQVRKSVVPATVTCPFAGELVVSVAIGRYVDTLSVPAGGPSGHPFSVAATATASLGPYGSAVVAVARTSEAVTRVRASFASGGNESAAPVQGWTVLVHRYAVSNAGRSRGSLTLVAINKSGTVLEAARLPQPSSLATVATTSVCRVLIVPVDHTGASKGAPTSAAGSPASSGAGSAGSSP